MEYVSHYVDNQFGKSSEKTRNDGGSDEEIVNTQ